MTAPKSTAVEMGIILVYPTILMHDFAIDEIRFWDFLETTQKDELAKLKKQSDWKLKILERFDRMIKKIWHYSTVKKRLGC